MVLVDEFLAPLQLSGKFVLKLKDFFVLLLHLLFILVKILVQLALLRLCDFVDSVGLH